MLSRLSLRARLIGAFAVTTLFLLGMGAVALTATRTINAQLVAVQSDSLPSVAKAGEISGWVARYAISIYRHLAAIDPDSKKRYDSEIVERQGRVTRVLAEYAPLATSARERAIYDRLNATWLDYLKENKPILDLSRSGMNEDALERMQGRSTELQRLSTSLADQLVTVNNEAAEASRIEGREAFARTETIVLGAGIGGLVLSALLAFWIVRGVTGGIASVVQPMQALASGDLSVAIPRQGEGTEIGTIADAVQVFKTRLIEMRAMEEETVLARAGAEAQRHAAMHQMAGDFEQGRGRHHRHRGGVGEPAPGHGAIDDDDGHADRLAIPGGRGGSRASGLQRQHGGGRDGAARLLGAGNRPSGRRIGPARHPRGERGGPDRLPRPGAQPGGGQDR